MAEQASDDRDGAARRKFLHHFQSFNASIRFPAPYTGFAGKPMKHIAERGYVYDPLGYRTDALPGPRAAEDLRIFAVGDSTLLEGLSTPDTLPGRLETVLRATHGARTRVYNFGAISACLNQMTALITTRLMDMEPDLILVVGGATDIFQPWSFDPRAGYPFDHFVTECLQDYFFDPKDPLEPAPPLSYENLQALIFQRLANLRALTLWQSEPWEWEVVRQFELGLKRLARLSRGLDIPVRFVLQPTVVRKTTLVGDERSVASGAFLAYLDRQVERFARVVAGVGDGPLAGPHFGVHDLSAAFRDDARALFTDIVHVDSFGRQALAERLAADLDAVLPRPVQAEASA
ncbi:SGNH/GDSL hydrolase family protein [Methylobacterium sp. NEAU 140]|uniref:SGNH/GDSL hydrolase family protein n=1 Tax=Methylobacterium sp. NEAU 140 TaxID=3064945 RepID=UPI0027324793|nr:SGNH/GDSL hydrolase family protein [Methylobacterium sp. NEAU 140]MDP4024788.1 SGNH/GDSL hydrolase family protein [Methylobacterium sp. NEAU 140]